MIEDTQCLSTGLGLLLTVINRLDCGSIIYLVAGRLKSPTIIFCGEFEVESWLMNAWNSAGKCSGYPVGLYTAAILVLLLVFMVRASIWFSCSHSETSVASSDFREKIANPPPYPVLFT